jgi:hypothetical protein
MILISLKDGKEIKLNSKIMENSNETISNKTYNLRPASSSIVKTKKEATLNQINLNEDSNSSSLFSDTESNFDYMDHTSEISSNGSFQQSVGGSQEQKKKRQRLTHLTAEEKLMRRKLKNRVAAQSARDRKKVKMEELEQSVSILRSQNEQLRNENSLLKEKTRKLVEENQRLKSLNQTIKPMIKTENTIVQVVDVANNNTCLKRKYSELKDCVEVDESAAFISTVSLQKKQLQMSMFHQLIYVLIMYTMNLIKLNNNNNNNKTPSSINKEEIGYSKSTMSFCYQQQKRQQMNIKLKKTLLKLINLLKQHRPTNYRQILSESSAPPPTHQLSKLFKQLNLQQMSLNNNSKSFKLIILMSLITSLTKRKF